MYKWKIEIILNSGKEITVYYENKKNGLLDVGKEILEGNVKDIVAFSDKDRMKQIFIKKEEIAYMAVSVE